MCWSYEPLTMLNNYTESGDIHRYQFYKNPVSGIRFMR